MKTATKINGIDTAAIQDLVADIQKDPKAGMVSFGVTSAWAGQTNIQTNVSSWAMAGEEKPRAFTIDIDEPEELLGRGEAPNPQEMLMAAMNACMMVGYVANAALMGVRLERLEIETNGELDLRGFLGMDPDIQPGNGTLNYTIRVKGDGSQEQYEALHEKVTATSPNRWNIAQPVQLNAALEVL